MSDLDSTSSVIASGCFGRQIRVWRFPDCHLQLSINALHAVNCVNICESDHVVASSSRTGTREGGVHNVIVWSLETGDALAKLDLPSCCFVMVKKVSELNYKKRLICVFFISVGL